MVRGFAAISCVPMLVWAATAAAWDRDAVQLRATAGISAKASPHQYSTAGRLANTPHTAGVGASLRVYKVISASASVDYTWLAGDLAPMAWAPEQFPRVHSSNMTTALLGLEAGSPTPDRQGPFVSGGIGVGRLYVGAIRVSDLSGGSVDYPASREWGPAFEVGAGIRTPRWLGGPSFQLSLRNVSMRQGNRWVGITPLTVGVAF